MKREEFKKYNLPQSSGVYIFLDKKVKVKKIEDLNAKDILYIGKATILKDRVNSYFSKDLVKTRGTRILSMVENAKDLFYIETKSVLEAIILESKYIKKYKPFFNIKEMDDKSYSFVVFTKEDFPRVLIMREREIEKDKDLKILKKFGPFVSKAELLEIMKFLRKIFPFRDKCNIGEKRACFNYQIGICPGVCIGLISKKDYENNIKNIEKILSGNIIGLLKSLEKEMRIFAKKEKFEEAAKLRNTINSFKYLKDINIIKKDTNLNLDLKTKFFRIESYDISHLSGKNRVGVMAVFENGELNKNEYRKFKINESINDDISGLLEVLERRFTHTEWRLPDILVLDGGKTHLNFIYKRLIEILPKEIYKNIIFISVVKDEKHKAREIIYLKDIYKKDISNLKDVIFMLNEDTHRFAISYHKLLRNRLKKY